MGKLLVNLNDKNRGKYLKEVVNGDQKSIKSIIFPN